MADKSSRLPLEIESNILQRTQVEPLFRHQCVCKSWRDEIKNPNFIKSHTGKFQIHNGNSTTSILYCDGKLLSNLYSLNYHKSAIEFKKLARHEYEYDAGSGSSCHSYVVGCCNGLVCFQNIDDSPVVCRTSRFSLHNPVTGTTVNNIPQLVVPIRQELIGFGYDCINDDYKIFYTVRENKDNDDDPDNTWVYSLKRNSWENIQPHAKTYPDGYFFSMNMVNCNNNVSYWIDRKPYHTYDCVFGFDFESEEYHEIVTLADDKLLYSYDEDGEVLYSYKLVDLRGCLHLVKYGLGCIMDVWVLNKNRSWVKLIHRLSLLEAIQIHRVSNHFPGASSIDLYLSPMLYAYSEDDSEILIGLGHYIMAFVRCDLRTGKLKSVEIRGVRPVELSYGYQGMSWTGSLVSISSSSS